MTEEEKNLNEAHSDGDAASQDVPEADAAFDVPCDISVCVTCAQQDAPSGVADESADVKGNTKIKNKKEKKRSRRRKRVATPVSNAQRCGNGERGGWVALSALAVLALLICLATLVALMAECGVFRRITEAVTGGGSRADTVVTNKYIFVREDGTTGRLSIPEIADKVSPSVVGIAVKKTASSGVGSGIIKTSDGYIITNYHVTDEATEIYVITADGMNYPARYIGGNELADVAVIKIEAEGLIAAEFGDSDSLIVGETTVAIGTSGSMEYAGTVTTGIISCANRNVGFYDDSGLLQKTMHLIQTSTQINPGNSGGPLIDGDGRVIGINTYKIKSEGFEGLGFAIPINGALKVVDAILAGNDNETGGIVSLAAKLGITGMAVTRGTSFTYENESGAVMAVAEVDGVAVITIASDKYDAALKLKPGDIITSIDGIRASTIDDIREAVAKKTPGESVALVLVRSGAEIKLDVILGS